MGVLRSGLRSWWPGCATSEALSRWPNLLLPPDPSVVEKRYPFYANLVPKGWRENLDYRLRVTKAAEKDRGLQDDLRQMCRMDMLFWVNVFGWTVNPKSQDNAVVPVITPPFQVALFIDLEDSIGVGDLLLEKSREMYATWTTLIVFKHRFDFYEYVTFLCISRNEDMVDKRGDPKSLFWKIDFFNSHLPGWLRPPQDRTRLHYENLERGNTIDGESTTGSAGRGDRRTAIFLDEAADYENGSEVMASTQRATRSRIFNSTHQGVGTAFYELSRNPKVKTRFVHWSLSPSRAAGLYTTDDGGRLKIIDTDFNFPPGYPFVTDGRMRSPLQDVEFDRAKHPRIYDQEEDGDCMGSAELLFDSAVLARAMDEDVCDPRLQGELRAAAEGQDRPEVEAIRGGRFKVWEILDHAGRPCMDHVFTVGVDISAGVGASNSVVSVINATTRTKAAEWSSNAVQPDELAEICVDICRIFTTKHGPPRACWESNSGLGRTFGRVLMKRHSNVYWRKNEEEFAPREKDIPGWASGASSKRDWMLELAGAMRRREYTERSDTCIFEARMYILGRDGGAHHSRTTGSDEVSGSEKNHGDHCIATMIAWWLAKAAGERDDEEEKEVPYGSFAWRYQQWELKGGVKGGKAVTVY